MHELLAGLVPGLPLPAARSIIARADGIPLYAVETVRMLVSDGRLREADGHYEPVGDLGELAVPETLQALIAARLDGLDPADRTLLQDAAVLGHSFTLEGLAAVSGEEPVRLQARLRDLAKSELITQEIDPRSPERGMYGFVQALIREVAYGTLAKRDRRSRHLAAARFFESLGEDELAGALAGHYIAAWQSAPDGPEGDAVAVQARLALRRSGRSRARPRLARERRRLPPAGAPRHRRSIRTSADPRARRAGRQQRGADGRGGGVPARGDRPPP